MFVLFMLLISCLSNYIFMRSIALINQVRYIFKSLSWVFSLDNLADTLILNYNSLNDQLLDEITLSHSKQNIVLLVM